MKRIVLLMLLLGILMSVNVSASIPNQKIAGQKFLTAPLLSATQPFGGCQDCLDAARRYAMVYKRTCLQNCGMGFNEPCWSTCSELAEQIWDEYIHGVCYGYGESGPCYEEMPIN